MNPVSEASTGGEGSPSQVSDALTARSSKKANFDVRPMAKRQVELALRSSNLGDVEMKIADRIGLDPAFGGSFVFDSRNLGDPE